MDTDQLLDQQRNTRHDTKESAYTLRGYFLAMTDAGFNDEQAFALTLEAHKSVLRPNNKSNTKRK